MQSLAKFTFFIFQEIKNYLGGVCYELDISQFLGKILRSHIKKKKNTTNWRNQQNQNSKK